MPQLNRLNFVMTKWRGGLGCGGCWAIGQLLLPPVAGQQLHQRIEERAHRRGVLGELVAQHDRRADADLILGRVNRGLGR